MRRFVQPQRLQRELQIYTSWTRQCRYSSSDIYHRPGVQIHSNELKYPSNIRFSVQVGSRYRFSAKVPIPGTDGKKLVHLVIYFCCTKNALWRSGQRIECNNDCVKHPLSSLYRLPRSVFVERQHRNCSFSAIWCMRWAGVKRPRSTSAAAAPASGSTVYRDWRWAITSVTVSSILLIV